MTLTAVVGPDFRQDDGMERDRNVDGDPERWTSSIKGEDQALPIIC